MDEEDSDRREDSDIPREAKSSTWKRRQHTERLRWLTAKSLRCFHWRCVDERLQRTTVFCLHPSPN